MTKEITIGGKKYKFRSTAAIPRMYRIKFNRDIFVDMEKLQKDIEDGEKVQGGSSIPITSLEMFENIAYLMNKHGDPSQPDDVYEWLDQFDAFNIYEILPEILELWNLNNKGTSVSKKRTSDRQGV